MQVFFDAYYGQATDVGQPVQNQPMLSVDQQGQITMAFTTGDQDNLEGDVNMKNYVVSTTEVLEKSSGVNTFKSRLEWQFGNTGGQIGAEFTGGERVVGPLTLFDRVLYFSSVVPSTGTDCHQGFKSNIWAFDYLEKDSSTPPKPKNDLLDQRASLGLIQKDVIRDILSLVAGVGLRQLPSCSTIQTGVSSTDGFLGYGKITTISANAPGGFQLVYQKNAGNQKGTTAGPPVPPVQTIDLAPPNNLVQVDSWAPIIE
jgi:type IV pilus assembly protein PilY1